MKQEIDINNYLESIDNKIIAFFQKWPLLIGILSWIIAGILTDEDTFGIPVLYGVFKVPYNHQAIDYISLFLADGCVGLGIYLMYYLLFRQHNQKMLVLLVLGWGIAGILPPLASFVLPKLPYLLLNFLETAFGFYVTKKAFSNKKNSAFNIKAALLFICGYACTSILFRNHIGGDYLLYVGNVAGGIFISIGVIVLINSLKKDAPNQISEDSEKTVLQAF